MKICKNTCFWREFSTIWDWKMCLHLNLKSRAIFLNQERQNFKPVQHGQRMHQQGRQSLQRIPTPLSALRDICKIAEHFQHPWNGKVVAVVKQKKRFACCACAQLSFKMHWVLWKKQSDVPQKTKPWKYTTKNPQATRQQPYLPYRWASETIARSIPTFKASVISPPHLARLAVSS